MKFNQITPNKWSEKDTRTLVDMYKAGKSLHEIMDVLDIDNESRVTDKLMRQGYSIKNMKEEANRITFENLSRKEKLEFAFDNDFQVDRTRNELDFKFYYVIHAYNKIYTVAKDAL